MKNRWVIALGVAAAAGMTACSTLFPPEDQPPSIVRGDASRKQILLTFDSGATDQGTEQTLALLARYRVPAAFFLTGQWVERYPEAARRIAAAGHAICNHSYSHPLLRHAPEAKILAQLRQADAAIERITGRSSKPYFRAPYGEADAQLRRVAWHEGYRLVRWTVNPLDWRQEGLTGGSPAAGSDAFNLARRDSGPDRPLSDSYSLNHPRQDPMIDRASRLAGDTNAPPDPAGVFATNTVEQLKPGAILVLELGNTLSGRALPVMLNLLRERGYACVSLREGLEGRR